MFVTIQNVNKLNVKVFEINTVSYYRDKQRAIATDMNLDGLDASFEWTLNNKELGLKNAFHRKSIAIKLPSELTKKRGVYFLDLLSNGKHARCVLNIGDLRYVERVCEAGHCFKILDENNNIINKCKTSIFMDKHLYESNDNHEIFIPFTNSSNNESTIIIQRDDDPIFNVLSTFKHEQESYDLQCGLYIDREQLLEKKRASVIVRSGLFLNGKHRVSVKLLKNIKLSIKMQTSDGVDVDKTFDNFKLFDDKESVATFTVPNQPLSIHITLHCNVNNMTTNKRQNLVKTRSFVINGIDKTDAIAQLFLIPQPQESFILALYGKNGEGLSGKVLKIMLDCKLINATVNVDLTTDDNGRVYLPKMLTNNFKRLRVSCPEISRNLNNDWDIQSGLISCETPNAIQMIHNSSISIPYFSSCLSYDDDDDDVRYFGLWDKNYIQSYHDEEHLFYDPDSGYLTIQNLPVGMFVFHTLDLNYSINIYVSEYGTLIDNNRYNVNKNEVVELSPNKALQISSLHEDEEDELLQIKLSGYSSIKRTRVHVIATHMIPRFNISTFLDCISPSNLLNNFIGVSKNYYLKQRNLGEEYRYVLERQTQKKFIGNSLIKPSFLMKPLEHKQTQNVIQRPNKGGSIDRHSLNTNSEVRDHLGARNKNVQSSLSQISATNDRGNVEFVGKTSVILSNLKANDDDGMITIDTSQFNDNQKFVRVIAFDDESCVIRSICLSQKNAKMEQNDKYSSPIYKYADNTLSPGLDPLYRYSDCRDIISMSNHTNNNDELVVDDFKTSQIESFSTISDLFNCLQTISNNNDLKMKWSFICKWDTLSFDEKFKKYDEYVSHELHLFINKYDIEFFDKVCIPHISSKMNKDFMDHYLLNDKDILTKKYANNNLEYLFDLNTLERVLLLQITDDDDDKAENIRKGLLKYYQSISDSIIIDEEEFDKLFRTALAARSMDKKQMTSSNYDADNINYDGPDRNNVAAMMEQRIAQTITARKQNNRSRRLVTRHRSIYLADDSMLKSKPADNNNNRNWAYTFNRPSFNANAAPPPPPPPPPPSGGAAPLMDASKATVLANLSNMGFSAAQLRPDSTPSKHKHHKHHHKHNKHRSKDKDKDKKKKNKNKNKKMMIDNYDDDDSKTKDYGMSSKFGSDEYLQQRQETQQQQLFKQVETTKEYQDTFYWNVRYETITKNLIPENKFWCDFAIHYLDGDGKKRKKDNAFLSKWFLFATSNINEMLCVLCVMDLPFNSNGPQFVFGEKGVNDQSIKLITSSPTIVFVKQLKKYNKSDHNDDEIKEEKEEKKLSKKIRSSHESISIHVHYFDPLDKYTLDENGERIDKFEDIQDLRPGKVYGCRAILTNVSSCSHKIAILCQIPTGSIPIKDGFRTKTKFITLNAYTIHKLHFHFYFPSIGRFRQYPVTVMKNKKIIGSSSLNNSNNIIVKYEDEVNRIINTNDWNDVSLNGSNDEIVKYLSIHNFRKLDLSLIYFKLRDSSDLSRNLIDLCRKQYYYDKEIHGYSLYHLRQILNNNSSSISKATKKQNAKWFIYVAQYLSMNKKMNDKYLSPSFKNNGFFDYDDIDKHKYHHLEYIPLVNARAHLLGQKRKILNDSFRNQ